VPRPRILLCPQFTEVEWAVAPQLAEWAEVATFDAPGVGDEEPPEGGMAEINRGAVVDRALREVERQGWDSFFVAGDAWGTATAVRVAAAEADSVLGIALGHASVDYNSEGDRPAVNGELVAAMTQLLRSDYDSFVRYGLTQFTQGGFDEDTARRMVERFPPMETASLVWEMNVARSEPIAELLGQVDKPKLLAKHDGCLVFTPEGYEDVASAFPDASVVSVQTACSASDEFAAALRNFCERVFAEG
jgi:pimeloyl-ACP methyl ester carboxylesterase